MDMTKKASYNIFAADKVSAMAMSEEIEA